MSIYRTTIGAERIDFLVAPGGSLASVADHVQADTGDDMIFDGRVLQALRELDRETDGSITDDEHGRRIWFGGTPYLIEVVES